MLKLIFVAPKFILRRVQKKGTKGQKMKKSRFAKNTFLFYRVHEWEIVLRVNMAWKIVWGWCAHKKIFLTFFASYYFPKSITFSFFLIAIIPRKKKTIQRDINNWVPFFSMYFKMEIKKIFVFSDLFFKNQSFVL